MDFIIAGIRNAVDPGPVLPEITCMVRMSCHFLTPESLRTTNMVLVWLVAPIQVKSWALKRTFLGRKSCDTTEESGGTRK